MLSKKRRRLEPEWLGEMTRAASLVVAVPHDASTPAHRERARQLRLALCKPDSVLENGNLNPESATRAACSCPTNSRGAQVLQGPAAV